MRQSLTFVCTIVIVLVGRSACGQSVSTTLQFDTPNDPINVLSLNLSAGILGSASDTANLSGTMQATFDLANHGGGYDVTGVTLTGGTVSLSDVSFALGFGITAVTTGLAGTPFTTSPPGSVSAGAYNAADHGMNIDQGTVAAAGSTLNFATDPFMGTGDGMGSITATADTPVPGFDVIHVAFDLPVLFDETFEIPNVPVVGTINANLVATGTLSASATLQIPVTTSGLACDADADGDCELDDFDAMYAAIAAGAMGGSFDFDGDGAVTPADIDGWLTAASDPANTALQNPSSDLLVTGDIDLNGGVNSTDLGLLLNQFGSSTGPGWRGGDLNADLNVDSTDLGLLLNNFGHTSLAAHAVPEPSGKSLFLPIALGCLWALRFRREAQ